MWWRYPRLFPRKLNTPNDRYVLFQRGIPDAGDIEGRPGRKMLDVFDFSDRQKRAKKRRQSWFPTLPDVISSIAWSAIVSRRVPDVGNIGQRVIGVANLRRPLTSNKEAAFNSSAYLQYFRVGT